MTQFLLFCFLPPYGYHKGPGLSEKGSHPPPCSWLGHELSDSERGNRKPCWGLPATAEFSDRSSQNASGIFRAFCGDTGVVWVRKQVKAEAPRWHAQRSCGVGITLEGIGKMHTKGTQNTMDPVQSWARCFLMGELPGWNCPTQQGGNEQDLFDQRSLWRDFISTLSPKAGYGESPKERNI